MNHRSDADPRADEALKLAADALTIAHPPILRQAAVRDRLIRIHALLEALVADPDEDEP